MHPRFVTPGDTTTLRISRDETLTIKTRLNAGEQEQMHQRMFHEDGVPRQVRVNTLLAYLVDWTVKDADGRVAPYREFQTLTDKTDALHELDPEDFQELFEAVNAHVARLAAEREAEKKYPGWRDRIASDLHIARRCGWRVEWVRELDPDDYDVLIDILHAEDDRAETRE